MRNKFIIIGSFFALTATIAGALGAHALKNIIPPSSLESFKTGVEYQMYHAIALIFTGILMYQNDKKKIRWVGYFFIAGIFFFSGSIYALSTSRVTGIDFSFLGPVTPIGGLLFMTGWILIIFNFIKNKNE
jgi:uncharacterized membrane protein YgdD (TMEM256/DUF423 family)